MRKFGLLVMLVTVILGVAISSILLPRRPKPLLSSIEWTYAQGLEDMHEITQVRVNQPWVDKDGGTWWVSGKWSRYDASKLVLHPVFRGMHFSFWSSTNMEVTNYKLPAKTLFKKSLVWK